MICISCSRVLNIYDERSRGVRKCLLAMYCREYVLDVVISLGYLLYFCNFWGWICWTVPFKIWLIEIIYICNSFYYHQIRSIIDFRCFHICRGYIWAGCTIIFCQFCFCFHYNCAVYDACKCPNTLRPEGRICLFAHYTYCRYYGFAFIIHITWHRAYVGIRVFRCCKIILPLSNMFTTNLIISYSCDIEFDIDGPSNMNELLALIGPKVTVSRPRLRYTRDLSIATGRLIKPNVIKKIAISYTFAGYRVVIAHSCTFGGTLQRFSTFTFQWSQFFTIYKYRSI